MLYLQFQRDNYKAIVLLSIFITFAFLSLVAAFIHQMSFAQHNINNASNLTPYVEIKGSVIHVDLAITPDQQAKGLSIKNSLNDSEGMLFPFEKPGDYSFWMKDMKFPIDIIWIDPNNKIVHIEKNLQPCIFFIFCPSYSPDANAKYVLEVNSNYTTRHNITIGDSVYINIPKNQHS